MKTVQARDGREVLVGHSNILPLAANAAFAGATYVRVEVNSTRLLHRSDHEAAKAQRQV